MSEGNSVSEVAELVNRVQEFNPDTLVQSDRLGELAFKEAVEPARRLIFLFSKLSPSAMDELPENLLSRIKTQAKATLDRFEQILNFRLGGGDPESAKLSLLTQLSEAYQPTFESLFPLISYSAARTVDFSSLEARGRAAIHSINSEREELLGVLKETEEQATRALEEARKLAAETGVTREARYFSGEAEAHKKNAHRWLKASITSATSVLVYSVASFWFSTWFSPETTYEVSQLIASKVLVFVVLSYSVVQCVKNYAAERHNFVVNKHRQNALLTYTTLVEAGNNAAARDIVLTHAASAIYAPSDTGFSKNGDDRVGASLTGFMPLFDRGFGGASPSN